MSLVVAKLVAQLEAQDTGLKASLDETSAGLKRVDQQARTSGASVRKMAADASAAYERQQGAAAKLTLAEKRLADAKQSGNSSTEQLLRLEAGVRSARASSISTTSRYESTTRRLAQANQEATRSAGTLTASLGRARSALEMVGVGVGIAGLVTGMRQAVMAASDLSESTNAVDVSFGQSAQKVKDFAANAASSMGQSNVEARNAAVTMALYGKQASLSGNNLANFSIKMSQLASDMASFRNTSPEQAVEALGAAFRGESDPIEAYGVLMNETTLKNQAFKDGLISNTSDALAPAVRVQAVYNSVLQQTSMMQGDFARTSGSFANRLRVLKAEFTNTSAEIGEKLLPIAQAFVSLLSGPGMAAFRGAGDALGVVASMVGTLASAFSSLPGPVQGAIAGIVGLRLAQKMFGDQIETVRGRISGMADSVRGINVWSGTLAQTAQNGTIRLGAFGSAIGQIGQHAPAVARMQTAFINAAVGAERFPRAAGLAAGAMSGIRSAAGGLVGALGGPWGLAITGATALLGLWINKKQEDAQASQRASAQTQSWADQITQSGGKITQALRTDVYKTMNDDQSKLAVTGKTLATSLGDLGISGEDATNAVLKQGDAYERVTGKLREMAEWNLKHPGQGDKSPFSVDQMAGANEALEMLDRYKTNADEAKTKARQLAEATGDVSVSFDGSASSAGAMSQAMTDYAEATDGAASKVDKLAKALDQLNGDQLTQEEAQQAWSDGMRSVTEAMTAAGAAAITASGHIDVTTEAGSKLQDTVVSQSQTYNQAAAAAKEYADSQGFTVAQSLDYVREKVGPLRQQFIDQITAITGNRQAAEELANAYLGMPDEVITRMNVEGVDNAIKGLAGLKISATTIPDGKFRVVDDTPQVRARLDELKVKYSVIDGKLVISDNSPQVVSAMDALGVKVQALPGGYIQLKDTSPEVMQRLENLGIKVTTLPGGSIVINANDAEFWNRVREAQKPGQKQILVTYTDVTGATVQAPASAPRDSSGRRLPGRAEGGIDSYAAGGVRPLTDPTIKAGSGAGQVYVTPAGPVRAFESETDWEAFIPGAASKRQRSLALTAEVARRFGYGLIPMGGAAYGGGLSLLQRGNYDGSWSKYLGIEEDSPIVDFLRKRRAGQRDSPWVSAQKDVAAFGAGARGLARGDYDGVLYDRFNIEEDNPLVAAALAFRNRFRRNPIGVRKMADGGFSYGLPAGSTGGFPDWVTRLGAQYNVTPSTYAGHQETDRTDEGYAANPQHLNRGIDFTGSVANMRRLAGAMMAAAPNDPSIEQVIFQDPETGRKYGWSGRQDVSNTGYYDSDYPAHQNHVHLRVNAQVGAGAGVQGAGGTPGVRTVPLKQNPDGTWTSTDPEWAKLIQRESGGDFKVVQGVQDANSGGNEASGGFQIAKGTWAAYGGTKYAPTAGEATPEQQAEIAAAIFDKEGGSPWGAGMAGREDENALRAGIVTTGGTTGSGEFGGTGTPVQVTNWPSGFGTSTLSTGTSTGSDVSASDLTKADNDVADAKRKQGEAADKVKTAEQKLAEIRKDPKAKPSQIRAAEDAVTKAKNDQTKATDDLTAAEKKLSEGRADSTTKTSDKSAAEKAPKNPNVLDFTITNPYGAWWWKGEKEYQDRIIQENEDRKKYEEYLNGSGSSEKSEKGASGSDLTKAANGVADAQRKLEEARANRETAQTKLREVEGNPKAKESQIQAARNAITKAQNAVTKAEENLRLAQQREEETKKRGVVKMWTGGTVPGVGSGDIVPLMAEPGEEVTRRAMAIKHRALLKAINADKVQRLADGGTTGFGGYADDNSDYMKPTSLQDWVHLGIGGTSMVASGIAPLISMAASGKVDLGSALPSFSTDGNDPSGGLASTVVSDFASQISQQLADLIRAVKEGKDIHVTVDSGSGAADMVGMAARV